MDELHSKYAAAHNRSSIWSSVYYQTIMYTRELVFESEYIFVLYIPKIKFLGFLLIELKLKDCIVLFSKKKNLMEIDKF